jgi:hypothetical protein
MIDKLSHSFARSPKGSTSGANLDRPGVSAHNVDPSVSGALDAERSPSGRELIRGVLVNAS